MKRTAFDHVTPLLMLATCVLALLCLSCAGDASAQQIQTSAPPSMDGDFQKWHLPDGVTVRLGKGGLSEHEDALAFSSDGQLLAVASSIGIWLYDVATSRELALLPTEHPVYSVSFSPDGTILASGSWDATIGLWDVATKKQVARLEGHRLGVSAVSFSPDGTTLAAGSHDGTVKLWDVATEDNTATLDGHTKGVYSVSFSPDGTLVASGSLDDTVLLWDLAKKRFTRLEGHTDDVLSVSFSPDGTILASGSWDNTVKLWDVATRKNTATLHGHTYTYVIGSVSFSPDGTILAAGSDDTIQLWDVATTRPFARLERHTDIIRSVLFSPDGTILASGSEDGAVKLWDVAKKRRIATIEGHVNGVNSESFSPDGTLIASGSEDGMIRLWDVATGETIATIRGEGGSVNFVSFSPDSTTFASGSQDGRIRLWDVATRKTTAILRASPVLSGAFSPDGTLIASGSWDGAVRLWDVATKTQITTLYRHTSAVRSVLFSPDGTLIASRSWDGTIRLWDVATEETIATLLHEGTHEAGSMSFSPDGTIFAFVSYNRVRLWDVAKSETIATVADGYQVSTLGFSPDGTILASGPLGEDVLRLWDMATKTQIAKLEGHRSNIRSVLFSPDGTILASRSADNVILLWDVQIFQPHPQTLTKLSGDEQQGLAGTALANPLIVEVRDQYDNPLAGAQVTFTVTKGDGKLSEKSTIEKATTGANGRAERTLTLGSNPGTNIVAVTVAGLDPVTFIAVGKVIPQTLTKVSGDEQQGPAGKALSAPFVVSVLDQNGKAFPGATVAFAVIAGKGVLSVESATTDSSGQVASTLTLGSQPGTNTVEVIVAGLEAVIFTAFGEAIPQTLTKVSGDEQQGTIGKALSAPFVISVLDQNGVAYAGATVTFTITTGEGALSVESDTTDANGRAVTTLMLGSQPGPIAIEVTVEGLEPVTFTATAQATSDFNGDGIVGFADFVQFAVRFGLRQGDARYDARFDLDEDGMIGFGDFVIFANAFGKAASSV